MSKIAILYWEPGSGGDFVYSTMLAKPNEYQGIVDYSYIDSRGRVVPLGSAFFKENFEHTPGQWYLRTWTERDIDVLKEFSSRSQVCTVIPTHHPHQATFLKSHINNSIIIGITYPDNMFPVVLKNWCKKVAEDDIELQKIYDKPLYQYLKSKHSFGEFVLSEQLKFGSRIKASVGNEFDINISLEDLYSKHLSTLNSLFQDHSHVKGMFDEWIKKQNQICQFQYDVPVILQKALGYNTTSPAATSLEIELDQFDNVLIRHYNLPNKTPRFKTLQQASDFFKS